jgi:hypothetical protein
MLRYLLGESWTLSLRQCAAAGFLALAVASCKNESVKVEPADTNYYPLAVGDYRIFSVVDTIWNRNVRVVERYQFRERVTEEYTDAAGRRAFRIMRSKRATPAATWLDDSVLVISPSTDNVLVSRNNQRTVDLIFPVRENYFWNLNAFNDLNSIGTQDRSYVQVNQPFAVAAEGRTFSYPATITVFDESFEKLCDPYWHRQVYARNEGPVYRQRRAFTLQVPGTGLCSPIATYIHRGRSRTEVLLEQGR